MEFTEVNLETVGGGAIPELFAHELQRVLANIADPNTRETAPRTITITVRFTPNDDREQVAVEVEAKSKLAGPGAVGGTVYMTRRDGRITALAAKPDSLGLFTEQPRVVAMTQKEKADEPDAGDD